MIALRRSIVNAGRITVVVDASTVVLEGFARRQ